mmetsp:Transcript_12193/g.22590  ORF Transcript_12193/g.22590 Transcript_12193/m.22590 type:complete len:270 (-) Transcript_12193:207-1016(-)
MTRHACTWHKSFFASSMALSCRAVKSPHSTAPSSEPPLLWFSAKSWPPPPRQPLLVLSPWPSSAASTSSSSFFSSREGCSGPSEEAVTAAAADEKACWAAAFLASSSRWRCACARLSANNRFVSAQRGTGQHCGRHAGRPPTESAVLQLGSPPSGGATKAHCLAWSRTQICPATALALVTIALTLGLPPLKPPSRGPPLASSGNSSYRTFGVPTFTGPLFESSTMVEGGKRAALPKFGAEGGAREVNMLQPPLLGEPSATGERGQEAGE